MKSNELLEIVKSNSYNIILVAINSSIESETILEDFKSNYNIVNITSDNTELNLKRIKRNNKLNSLLHSTRVKETLLYIDFRKTYNNYSTNLSLRRINDFTRTNNTKLLIHTTTYTGINNNVNIRGGNMLTFISDLVIRITNNELKVIKNRYEYN